MTDDYDHYRHCIKAFENKRKRVRLFGNKLHLDFIIQFDRRYNPEKYSIV
jgi:hypothetical protein